MRAHYKRNLFDSQPLVFTNVAKFVPPEIRHLNRQTDGHKSRFRLYIDRGERLGRVGSGKTTRTLVVKNSVLPRWCSAAIICPGYFETFWYSGCEKQIATLTLLHIRELIGSYLLPFS